MRNLHKCLPIPRKHPKNAVGPGGGGDWEVGGFSAISFSKQKIFEFSFVFYIYLVDMQKVK
jgi:hypothetical protein